MPIYEYQCQDCQSEVSTWFSSIAQAATNTAVCTACGSQQLTRLVSNIAVGRSGSTTGGASAVAGSPSSDQPQALALAMHAAAAGRDMGSDFREVAARLEKGESAAAVEATLRKRVGEKMQPH
jgi:putative FmdB family regulatory protein